MSPRLHAFLLLTLCALILFGCNSGQPSYLPPDFITLEVRYQMPEAGEVTLIWGINDWEALPEDALPVGTFLKNGVMNTPMVKDGDSFAAKIKGSPWSTVKYGFLVTKASDGTSINPVWDGSENFKIITSEKDGVIDVISQVRLPEVQVSMVEVPTQLMTHEFRYSMPEAGEVCLVWGINGWGLIPEEIRPTGTVVKNKLMHTPMIIKENDFIAKVQVKAGVTIDYGFLIKKASNGEEIGSLWEGRDSFRVIVEQDGVTVVDSMLKLPQGQATTNSGSTPLVTQEFRYRMPDAGEVFLIWGINAWGVVPEDIRPAGTVVKNNLMHTPMARDGTVFISTVQVPAGTPIDYGFLITKSSDGTPIKVWETNVAQPGPLVVTQNGVVEVVSEVH